MYFLRLQSFLPITIILITSIFSCAVSAEINQDTQINFNNTSYYRAPWGIGIGLRRADIPFIADHDAVYDVIPLMQYNNKYVFLDGLDAGIHLWRKKNHEINLFSHFRFEDLPKEIQNKIQADGFDLGLQYRYTQEKWQTDLALMTADSDKFYSFGRIKYQWIKGDWQLEPYAQITWKSSHFNQAYYGLNFFDVSAGTAISGGINAKYHVISNLYLLGSFGIHRLEDNIVKLPIINSQYQYTTFLGFGFYPDPNKPLNHSDISNHNQDKNQFVRIAHGWATPSDLSEVFMLHTKSDPSNNQLTSISYGTRLSKELFNLPIELYFTPGFVWHQESSVQNNSHEVFAAVKAFYTFEFGPRWQFGIAEGMSYVNKLTYIEAIEMAEKNYRGSKLLNYLDFSLGVNVGDLFQQAAFDDLWFGYSIHHRSGMFEASAAFGRVKGGSNYQTLYLQWQF